MYAPSSHPQPLARTPHLPRLRLRLTDVVRLHILIDRTLPQRLVLVAVHGHTLRAAAHLPLGGRADRSAAAVALCTALLECQELLGAERLVVGLGCCLDEVLQVRSEQEVAQVHELAVVLVLDVDNAPSVLATTNLLAVNDDVLLGTDNREGNKVLERMC